MTTYPPQLPLDPVRGPVRGTITPPGSKSITNRALVLAALASVKQPITLSGCLDSEDTDVMVDSLKKLGYLVEDGTTLCVHRGDRPVVPNAAADLFVGNSGTTMRFLTALVSLGHGSYRLDGIPRMRERPIADLLLALSGLGIHARCEADNGCPPVVIEGGTWRGGTVAVKGDISSQFLSGLLLAAPFAPAETTFAVSGPLVSRPYVDMTVAMLRQWGLTVTTPDAATFVVPARQSSPRTEYAIEPDASSASYFLAAAAITGGRVTVPGLSMASLQGDVRFVDALEQMGCAVERAPGSLTVHGRPLRGIDLDMNAISDTVMTLAAVALFAEGPTTIRNVAHVRHKETDRLAAVATELRRLGAEVQERDDGLTITPRPLRGATVQTYNDHRMAMSLALVGLRVPGVVIDHPACVAKTYPGYFTDLLALTSGGRP